MAFTIPTAFVAVCRYGPKSRPTLPQLNKDKLNPVSFFVNFADLKQFFGACQRLNRTTAQRVARLADDFNITVARPADVGVSR